MKSNPTLDPDRLSWVESANAAGTDFPLQNLPYGVFRTGPNDNAHIGVAIGDRILDLAAAALKGLLPDALRTCCTAPTLNPLMAAGPDAWRTLRAKVGELLAGDACPPSSRAMVNSCLVSMSAVEMLLPAVIGDFTDFYASLFHARNVGSMFRPEQPLLPNYKWLPVGYHGRSSSIVVSGTPVRRPRGQLRPAESSSPVFAPCLNLDYELELGAFVGQGSDRGESIPIADAPRHLFGVVLLNDWSARDIQSWEYQPLGPFLAKNFATTLSPWVIAMEALAPFRAGAFKRPPGDPAPLPHLADPADQEAGGIDVTLEASLLTPQMRSTGLAPQRLSVGSFREMYWTFAQMLAHHSSNGCNLRPGDLLGSGTVSGDTKESRGCLLELTRRGAEPIVLPGGEERRFLQDGDEVILRGYCQRAGVRRIGFGECRGLILPAGDRRGL